MAESSVMADFRDDVDVIFKAISVPDGEPFSLAESEEWVYLQKEGEGEAGRRRNRCVFGFEASTPSPSRLRFLPPCSAG